MLGGWLTENFDWRWVFFINLPVGVLALLRHRALPAREPAGRAVKLDMFGFVTLSLAIGLLQMFLDRGEQLDWFDSVGDPARGRRLPGRLRVLRRSTPGRRSGTSFFDRDLLQGPQLRHRPAVRASSSAWCCTRTMALLPTLLQGLMGYPVVYTGMVMAPRGIGTMIAMLAGRPAGAATSTLRAIMALGFALTAISLWQMTRMTLEMDSRSSSSRASSRAWASASPSCRCRRWPSPRWRRDLRNEGTPIFSLLRNIGCSVGISIVQAMLTAGTARAHAELAADIAPGNLGLAALPGAAEPGHARPAWRCSTREVTRQAAMMAYLDDFRIMMALTLLAMPLLLLIRKARPAAKKPGRPSAEPELVHEV